MATYLHNVFIASERYYYFMVQFSVLLNELHVTFLN